MKFYKVPMEDNKGNYFVFKGDEIEYGNPIEHYSKNIIAHRSYILSEMVKTEYRKKGIDDQFAENYILKKNTNDWNDELQEMMKMIIPENFTLLLKSTTKKEQQKLLKSQSISSQELFVFICKAWSDYGYTFSEYRSEKYSKGTDRLTLPNLIYLKNNVVDKVGETSLSEGQLKQVIEHRKVLIAKILDKEKDWHCFLLTYKSLKGQENWKDGKPHLHYLSNKWGIDRADLVKKIKEGEYPSTPIHIELFNHRSPKSV